MIGKGFGKAILQIIDGDITTLEVAAIVNAANSYLQHGGGVAGAISRKGGVSIQEESNIWVAARGEVPVGSCAITSGGQLPARYVIHAVGPQMGEGDEDLKLQQATLASLKMAEKHNLTSIAFPAISTGIFGYPMERCAAIMLKTVIDYLVQTSKIEKVVFCLYGQEAYDIFESKFNQLAD